MKTEMKRTKLLQALEAVSPATTKTNIEDLTKYFIFFEDFIAGYDGEKLVAAPIKTGLFGVTDASDLLNLIKKLGSKTINISTDKKNLSIKAGNVSSKLFWSPQRTVIHKLIEKKFQAFDWKGFPEDTRNGIILCSFSAYTGTSRAELVGVYISEGVIAATDRYRIALFNHSATWPTVRIPASAAVLLKQHDFNEYCFKKPWLHFKAGNGITLSVAVVKEDKKKPFPIKVIKKLLRSKKEFKNHLPKNELEVGLDRCSFLLSDDYILDRAVELEFKDNTITLKMQKKDRGSISETISMDKMKFKKKVSIKINPDFLLEALKYGTAFHIDSKKHKFLIKSDTFTHLINLHKEE